jgi:hypothetical protein
MWHAIHCHSLFLLPSSFPPCSGRSTCWCVSSALATGGQLTTRIHHPFPPPTLCLPIYSGPLAENRRSSVIVQVTATARSLHLDGRDMSAQAWPALPGLWTKYLLAFLISTPYSRRLFLGPDKILRCHSVRRRSVGPNILDEPEPFCPAQVHMQGLGPAAGYPNKSNICRRVWRTSPLDINPAWPPFRL